MYDLGDIVTLGLTVKDATGTLANAGAVTCTITKPDATTGTGTVTNPGAGTYQATFTSTLPGRHTVLWQATGANAGVEYDEFDVRPAASTALLSLADARQSLNFLATTNDQELKLYIDAATDLIEQEVGPILPRTITETVHGWGSIALSYTPVLSVTSINGQLTGSWNIDPTDINVDPTTGIMRRVSRDTFYDDYYTVVYVAGRSTVVPERFRQAARDVITNLWRSQRGSNAAPGMGNADGDTLSTTNALTPQVMRDLKWDMKIAGIA